jgi:hypothetical protein
MTLSSHIPRAERDRGVADGIRTRDRRHHKPELYQLSYCHRGAFKSSGLGGGLGLRRIQGMQLALR